MKGRGIAIKVGILLTIIVVIFVIGQLWMIRFNIGKEGYILKIWFNDVSGLKIGDPVRVFGISKGKVINMEILPQGVMVTTWMEKDINLKKDAIASIMDVAMISGTKTIVLDPGVSEEPFDISSTLIGKPSLGLSTVEVGGVVTSIETLIEILKKGLGEEGAIKSIETTLNDLDIILKENRAGIKDIVDKGGPNLDNAKELIEELTLTTNRLKSTIEQINSKKGTVGKMIYDENLYDNLVSASASLDSLLIDIRKNPGKYVHISIF